MVTKCGVPIPPAHYATAQQVAQAAYNAGFRGSDLLIAISLTVPESVGGLPPGDENRWANITALNPCGLDMSYGAWQINMRGALGPARRKQFGIANNEALYVLQTNANAAYSVYRQAGNRFTPWSTYLNRSYLAFHIKAAAYAAHVDPNYAKQYNQPDPLGLDKVPGAVGNVVGGIPDLVSFFANPHTYLRVAMFIGGGVLLVIGLLALLSGTKTAGMIAGAVPAGTAVNTAARAVAA